MIQIQTSFHPRIATVTLNRPDKRNALSADLVRELTGTLDRIAEDDRVRVVVLTGSGTAFSAGADLAALESMQTASFEDNLADSQLLAGLFDQIDGFPKPVIGMINGHAIAGGCGLAAVCDISVAADHARFGFTEVRIGFVPALVSVFLRHRLGDSVLRDLLLSGRLLGAEEAVSLGVITRTAPAGELETVVGDLARDLVRHTSPEATRRTKRLLRALRDSTHAEALEFAARENAEARATEDCRAGIAAFLEKGTPPWTREFDREAGDE